MGLSKEKIAEILSINKHHEASKWEYNYPSDSFTGRGESGELIAANLRFQSAETWAQYYLDEAIKEINSEREDAMDDKAEDVIQDYREFLAGQGGVSHEPKEETVEEAVSDHDIILRLSGLKADVPGFAAHDIQLGLDMIQRLSAKIIELKGNANKINTKTRPTADEALEILNREEHNGLEWRIMAVSNHDSDVTLEYAELIGTAMYYREIRRG